MLKKFIDKYFEEIQDKNINNINAFLGLFMLSLYILTLIQIRRYEPELLEFMFKNPANKLDDNLINITYIAISLLSIACFFLLLHLANTYKHISRLIIIELVYWSKIILKHYPESAVRKEYPENKNIVRKREVVQYLQDYKDTKLQEKLDSHLEYEQNIYRRKRYLAAIAVLLIVNFFLNRNYIDSLSSLYWLCVSIPTILLGIIPYESIEFMYIPSNKIRK